MPNAVSRAALPARGIDGIPRTLPAAMRAELPSLTDEIIAEVRRLIPEYARILDGPNRETLRESIGQTMKTFVDLVADPSAPKDDRDAMCRMLGEYEAREGRTLDDLQAAYRIGCQIAWRRMTKVVLHAELPAAVITALGDALLGYGNELAIVSADGYRAEQRRLGQSTQRHRGRLLRLILEQPAVSRQIVEEVAEQADWPLPESVTLVAVRPVADSVPEDVRVDGDILADLSGPHPLLLIPGTLLHTRQAALATALEGYQIAVGLTVPLGLAAASLRWAQQALALTDADVIEPAPVISCEDHLIELWLLSDMELAQQITRRQMGVLEQIPANERAWLIDTFEPWLERRGTATEIAAMLGVHVQTIRYRINRLKELFGRVVDDRDSRLLFELTLRARRMLPDGEALTDILTGNSPSPHESWGRLPWESGGRDGRAVRS